MNMKLATQISALKTPIYVLEVDKDSIIRKNNSLAFS